MLSQRARLWIKSSDQPLPKFLFARIKQGRTFEIPAPKIIYVPLRMLYHTCSSVLSTIMRIFFWTPMFRCQCQRVGKGLYLYGGLPYTSGALTVSIGKHCRMSGHSTFSGRTAAHAPSELRIGDNVDIGWMTTIAVGQRVLIGNNVRIAGRAFLAGYPGHPIDALDRAAGRPDTEDQIGDITLEDDVWLATGVSIMAGVNVGRGTIVAAGSVVCKNLPAGVIAAGIPAKVVRVIDGATT